MAGARSLATRVAVVWGIALTVAAAARAQPAPAPADAPRLLIAVTPLVGLPRGEFGELVDSSPGVTGRFGYRLGGSPFWIGAEFGMMRYGHERRFVPLSLTLPDLPVEVRTNNYLMPILGLVRFQADGGSVRPYFEGLVGFSYLTTRTSVDLDTFNNVDRNLASTTNFDDLTSSLGAGAGVLIALAGTRDVRVSLDVGLRYLRGGEADYLTQGSIIRDGGTVTLNVSRSRTDVATVHVGVAVEF